MNHAFPEACSISNVWVMWQIFLSIKFSFDGSFLGNKTETCEICRRKSLSFGIKAETSDGWAFLHFSVEYILTKNSLKLWDSNHLSPRLCVHQFMSDHSHKSFHCPSWEKTTLINLPINKKKSNWNFNTVYYFFLRRQ